MYPTKTVEMQGTDASGNTVAIPVTLPVSLPSEDRCDLLQSLWSQHVKHEKAEQFGWKGPCHALVEASIAADVAEAMDFMGAIVDDRRTLANGQVLLSSRGYYAHGF